MDCPYSTELKKTHQIAISKLESKLLESEEKREELTVKVSELSKQVRDLETKLRVCKTKVFLTIKHPDGRIMTLNDDGKLTTGPKIKAAIQEFTKVVRKKRKMYTEILKKYNVEQTPEFTLKVLVAEIGKIHSQEIYKERFGKSGVQGDEEMEHADLLTMTLLRIEQMNYDLEKLKHEGLERFEHRIQEVALTQLREKHRDPKF